MTPNFPATPGAPGNVARLELENLARFGPYPRLRFEGQSHSNVEELQYAGSLAFVLRERGIVPGDRVMVVMPNTPDLTASLQAIWLIGAVVVPIIPYWTAAEISYALRHSQAIAILTLPALVGRVHEACRGVEPTPLLLSFGATECGFENIYPEVEQASCIDTPVDRSPRDLAMLLYTSGTSGKPKGVMVTHENIAAAVECANALNPDLPRYPMLHVLPLTHSFGLIMLKLAQRWGLQCVLMPQFDPVKIFQAIEQHQIGYMPVVPTMLVYLLHHPERSKFNCSSLYRITSGGAPLPEKLRQDFQQAFGCRVDQGYGLSESVAIAAAYDNHEPYRPGGVGRAEPGIRIRIVDDKNRTLPPLQAGEVCLAGANITPGYWQDPVATQEAFQAGWFRTGDIGYLDADGYLHITDRKKELIIKGGENISPSEIEEALYLHPAIAEAAVIGVPDNVFGEEICAVIELKLGIEASGDEIRRHLAQHVTKFKIPRHVVFQAALPKNAVGKIQKRAIREQFLAAEVAA
jgi:long-chain acyl-CoA synthetase